MVQRQPPTRSGRLSDVARFVVQPAGIVSTGWPAVRDTCAAMGITFDEWQDGAGRLILAKRADGMFASTVGGVVLSIPRQVGKTFLIGAIVFALCMLNPGLTVIWTAHRARTAGETFLSMRAMAKRKRVAPHIRNIVLGSGEEAVEFHNGSRVLFGARERGFGLGFAKVSILVLDEAQRLTDTAIDDMIPTTNQAPAPFPLVFYMGTPPRPNDPGEVFNRKRSDAINGESDDTVYIEFSADSDAHSEDRKQWVKANPSFPHHTPEPSMLRMKKNLTPDSFRREALGIWDATTGAIPNWATLKRSPDDSVIVSNQTWAVSLSPADAPDLWAAVGKAGRTSDGVVTIQTVKHDVGMSWVVPLVVDLYKQKPIPVRIGPGPERALVEPLREAGVEVIEVSAAEDAASTTALVNATKLTHHEADDDHPEPWVELPSVFHIGQASLTKSVENARLDRGSDGSVKWNRRGDVDITPLKAVTVALGGVPQEVMAEPLSQIW
jgi:hypothetical protein